ncbi:hypothetical protein MPLB_1690053 [Mesorhizobium sp. ORS 3324]|nr:hypothetical protein MPLB_1690053 [Mesorhizobium sp. ORS 3324]
MTPRAAKDVWKRLISLCFFTGQHWGRSRTIPYRSQQQMKEIGSSQFHPVREVAVIQSCERRAPSYALRARLRCDEVLQRPIAEARTTVQVRCNIVSK